MAAALLLIGFAVNFYRHYEAMYSARQTDDYFKPAVTSVNGLNSKATMWKTEFEDAKTQFTKTFQIGDTFLQNVQGRVLWLEVLRSVNACLPRSADGFRQSIRCEASSGRNTTAGNADDAPSGFEDHGLRLQASR